MVTFGKQVLAKLTAIMIEQNLVPIKEQNFDKICSKSYYSKTQNKPLSSEMIPA